MVERNDEKLRFLSIEKMENTQGACYLIKNQWWAYCPERGLIFYSFDDCEVGQHYQTEEVAKKYINSMYPWAEVKFMEFVVIKEM